MALIGVATGIFDPDTRHDAVAAAITTSNLPLGEGEAAALEGIWASLWPTDVEDRSDLESRIAFYHSLLGTSVVYLLLKKIPELEARIAELEDA